MARKFQIDKRSDISCAETAYWKEQATIAKHAHELENENTGDRANVDGRQELAATTKIYKQSAPDGSNADDTKGGDGADDDDDDDDDNSDRSASLQAVIKEHCAQIAALRKSLLEAKQRTDALVQDHEREMANLRQNTVDINQHRATVALYRNMISE